MGKVASPEKGETQKDERELRKSLMEWDGKVERKIMGWVKMSRKGKEGIGSKIIGIELGERRDVNNFKNAVMRIKRKIQEESGNWGSVRQLGIASTVNRGNGRDGSYLGKAGGDSLMNGAMISREYGERINTDIHSIGRNSFKNDEKGL